MKAISRNIIYLGLILLLVSHNIFPCTSFALNHNGYFLFSTNYDNEFAPGLIYVNKRNVKKAGWEPGTGGETAAWISRYGSITFACVGYQLPWAGMNEAGFAISTMALSETRSPNADERPGLVSPLWMQYVLDTCSTIEEVIESDKRIRISDTQDHYLVCDRKGNCAVIEFLDGKMIAYMKDTLPVKVLANRAYSSCVQHWKQKASSLLKSYDSRSRFARVAEMMDSYQPKDDRYAVEYAFRMLKEVDSPNEDLTRWSIVFDTGNFRIFYRSYANKKIRRIDFKKFDFNCGTPVKMVKVHNDLSGNVTSSFFDYSHDLTVTQLIKAVSYFRPGFPEQEVRRLLQILEGFSCNPE